MPVLNGSTADTVVKGSMAIIALLILAITYIIVQGQPVPQEFSTLITALVTGLLGLVTGTRIITQDVSAKIKAEPLTKKEAEIIEHTIVKNEEKETERNA